MKIQNANWYFFLLLTAFLLLYISLGPGIHGNTQYESRWQYLFFSQLCHQNPDRSYTVNDVPMAVCSRCFGIYSSFAAGMLAMPLLAGAVSFSKKWMIRLLALAILLNTIDVIANLAGMWTNTLNSRFFLGISIGLTITIILRDAFFKPLNKVEIEHGTK